MKANYKNKNNMEKEILDLIDRYWKFNDQMPASNWHDKNDLLDAVSAAFSNQEVAGRDKTDADGVLKGCLGRISDSVFNDLKSIDDLIIKMGTTKDGHKISGVGAPKDFKLRMGLFKEFLKKELPEFSEEEILKIDKHFHTIRKIYDWYGAEYFLTAIEYSIRDNYRKQK